MRKFRNRLLAIGMAACLAAGLAACGGSSGDAASSGTTASAVPLTDSTAESAASAQTESAADSAAGIYKLVEMVSGGETISADDLRLLESAGMVSYIAMSDDGTFYIDLGGDDLSGTWADGTLTAENETIPYTLDGDELVLSNDEISMTFTRSSQEEIDAILANASESAESGAADATSAANSTDTADDAESSSGNTSSTAVELTGDYSTEEAVLFDTDEASMTITGYDAHDSYYGFVVDVRCENKSSDRTEMFSVGSAAIDGYMVLPLFSAEATPGNTVTGEIDFDREELERAGITSVDELTLEVSFFDSDTYDTIYSDTVTVYPTGKSAEEIDYPERTASKDDAVAVDDDNVAFMITGMTHDDMWEAWDVTVYMENKTDKTLNFSWDNVAVNGSMIDPYWAKEVMPGKKAYADISFYDSKLEENGITDIASIEYELRASDAEDWLADALVDETFTWNP